MTFKFVPTQTGAAHPNVKDIMNMEKIPQKCKSHPMSGPFIRSKLKLALHSKRPITVASTFPTASKGVSKSKVQKILGKENAPSASRKSESHLLPNVSSIKASKPSDCNRATLARDIIRALGFPQFLPANLSSTYESHVNTSNPLWESATPNTISNYNPETAAISSGFKDMNAGTY
ncbi:hypothetical protein FIBSPDRAFT_883471 [Athelia psychrophila]|uniref:Uncharacterized protein n=1 Tax=Athelia psychrophila TaxID=1759441 RepID=A0A166U1A3_9AGAM|nr:hypothetical protein FIBSPDRAFT_883471 [Fibularhizoctonia sp. CBS 109695]